MMNSKYVTREKKQYRDSRRIRLENVVIKQIFVKLKTKRPEI